MERWKPLTFRLVFLLCYVAYAAAIGTILFFVTGGQPAYPRTPLLLGLAGMISGVSFWMTARWRTAIFASVLAILALAAVEALAGTGAGMTLRVLVVMAIVTLPRLIIWGLARL